MDKQMFKILRGLFITAEWLSLAACGQRTVNPTMTSMPVLESPGLSLTLTPMPTFAPAASPSPVSATLTPLPIPSPEADIETELERLRVVFVKDGNLYVQNGMQSAIQLTHSGKDREPIVSDDGQKIVFYRGETNETAYSINADGSDEQMIIQSKALPVLAQGEVRARTFVPHTHFLLFNTYLCNSSEALYDAPECTAGLFSVDVDSSDLRQIVLGLAGNTLEDRNFEVSPNGKFVSVAASGHIDIYSLYGGDADIFQQDAISFSRTVPDEYLPHQYWLADSSGMIVVLANSRYNEPTTPPESYAVFRYQLGETAVQIPLSTAIMWSSGCNFSVSPDREWIYFVGTDTGDPFGNLSFYLENLADHQSQRYEWISGCPSTYYSTPRWSPDSKHFAYETTISSVDSTPVQIKGTFLDWVDTSHYIYKMHDENTSKDLLFVGEIGGKSIALPENFTWSSTFVILPEGPQP